jgi:hypothetical protein
MYEKIFFFFFISVRGQGYVRKEKQIGKNIMKEYWKDKEKCIDKKRENVPNIVANFEGIGWLIQK